jgi:hypothetical protein
VTHQLLLHTNRSSLVVEDCPVSMPEGIPSEIRDANRLPCRVQMIVPQRISMERPAGIYVWKQPLISGHRALLFPLYQQSQNVGIEYNFIL